MPLSHERLSEHFLDRPGQDMSRAASARLSSRLLEPRFVLAHQEDVTSLLRRSSNHGRFAYMSMTTTASGLQYEDTKVGSGETAQAGKTCVMHYTGWLWVDGQKGSKFDSSRDRGRPFEFPLGAGRVIRGWDEGVAGMQIGGQRTLLIPADLGYGPRGAGGVIPPNATLLFEVELLGLR